MVLFTIHSIVPNRRTLTNFECCHYHDETKSKADHKVQWMRFDPVEDTLMYIKEFSILIDVPVDAIATSKRWHQDRLQDFNITITFHDFIVVVIGVQTDFLWQCSTAQLQIGQMVFEILSQVRQNQAVISG